VGLALTGEEGLIVEANPALARLLGGTPEELAGRRLLDFSHPDDKARSSSVGADVASGDSESAQLDKRYVTLDGREVPVRVTMIELDEPSGKARKVTQVEDLSERRETESRLRREAYEDPLTGLPNRRQLQESLQPVVRGKDGDPQQREAPSRDDPQNDDSEPHWAVLFIDLQDFKAVNDTYGHRIGDEVLVAVARRLAGITRDADLVARFGGDEFVLLIQIAAGAEVEQAKQRVRRSLARPVQVEGNAISVRATIGSAIPRPADSADDVLERADRDMYAAKERSAHG
jgi:diguanylate cyclase (GGDEF)-like protein/PAS domain S-box-containing protein